MPGQFPLRSFRPPRDLALDHCVILPRNLCHYLGSNIWRTFARNPLSAVFLFKCSRKLLRVRRSLIHVSCSPCSTFSFISLQEKSTRSASSSVSSLPHIHAPFCPGQRAGARGPYRRGHAEYLQHRHAVPTLQFVVGFFIHALSADGDEWTRTTLEPGQAKPYPEPRAAVERACLERPSSSSPSALFAPYPFDWYRRQCRFTISGTPIMCCAVVWFGAYRLHVWQSGSTGFPKHKESLLTGEISGW